MGKAQSARVHGKRAKAEHEAKRLTPAEIRQQKCLRTKGRNAARKAANIEKNEELAKTAGPRRAARIAMLKSTTGGFARERRKFGV